VHGIARAGLLRLVRGEDMETAVMLCMFGMRLGRTCVGRLRRGRWQRRGGSCGVSVWWVEVCVW